MHDDQFTAHGPSHPTSGVDKAAFSTDPTATDFEFGVSAKGKRFGVVGTSTNQGIAAVYGKGRFPKFGVLGISMGSQELAEIGVVGASVDNTNDLENLNIPGEAFDLASLGTGHGIGVLGSSGTGLGVRGVSEEGSGGEFTSQTGPGVRGHSTEGSGGVFTSATGRGGAFKSGAKVAQVNLFPWLQTTREPALPKQGEIGDLLLIHNKTEEKGDGISTIAGVDTCSLWLCVPTPLGELVTGAQGAFWREIQLGAPIEGTVV